MIDGCRLTTDRRSPFSNDWPRLMSTDDNPPPPQANAYAMIRRRAATAGIAPRNRQSQFRATGITAYLNNGGTLERAAAMANHASTRTTQLYDRRCDRNFSSRRDRARRHLSSACTDTSFTSPRHPIFPSVHVPGTVPSGPRVPLAQPADQLNLPLRRDLAVMYLGGPVEEWPRFWLNAFDPPA